MQEKYLETRHGQLCYFEQGIAGQGPSILLLHATGFHARCWDGVVARLADSADGAKPHVIAVDQLGHGRSHRPESLADWSVTADATAHLAEQLDIHFDLAVGHSMGGCCLTLLAASQPQRFGKLLLIDPVILPPESYAQNISPDEVDPSGNPVSKRRANWDSAQQMFDRLKGHPSYALWDKDVLMDYCVHGLLPAPDGDGFQLACLPHLEASVYMGSVCVDPYPHLSSVIQPTKILRAPGMKDGEPLDFTKSPTPEGLASKFPDAADMFIPDLTHFMPMQDPARIAQIMGEMLT